MGNQISYKQLTRNDDNVCFGLVHPILRVAGCGIDTITFFGIFADGVGATILNDVPGHLGHRDESHSADEHLLPGLLETFANLAGQIDLVVRVELNLLVKSVTARRYIQKIDAELWKHVGELDALWHIPAFLAGPFHPFRGRDAEEQGHRVGDGGANGLDALDQEADAVFEAASVLIGALLD